MSQFLTKKLLSISGTIALLPLGYFAYSRFIAPSTHRFSHGGFAPEMSKREASLVLGIRETASLTEIKEAHRTLMSLNHPDIGGSPFISTKINEAKELLEKSRGLRRRRT